MKIKGLIKKILPSKRSILIILPFLILAIAAMYIPTMIDSINQTLLAEKFIEKKTDIDLIANTIDKFIELDDDWRTYDYQTIVGYTMQYLDEIELTYAAAYDKDLNNLSHRNPSFENSPFEPPRYADFITAVEQNESGELILPFTPQGAETRDMYVYFKWIPTDKNLDGRFLTVVAISKYSVTSQVSQWITAGSIIFIVVCFLICFPPVILSGELGYVKKMRQGEKWYDTPKGEADGR